LKFEDRSTVSSTIQIRLQQPVLFLFAVLIVSIIPEPTSKPLTMTKFFVALALAFSGASAFTARDNVVTRPSTGLGETKADLEDMAAKLNPVLKFWDPLGRRRLKWADLKLRLAERTILEVANA
jgi:hypothetical protein